MADIEVETEVTGNVWKVLCQVGDRVETEQELVILESMKMEIPVEAPQAGTVKALNVGEGDAVDEGQIILVLRTNVTNKCSGRLVQECQHRLPAIIRGRGEQVLVGVHVQNARV